MLIEMTDTFLSLVYGSHHIATIRKDGSAVITGTGLIVPSSKFKLMEEEVSSDQPFESVEEKKRTRRVAMKPSLSLEKPENLIEFLSSPKESRVNYHLSKFKYSGELCPLPLEEGMLSLTAITGGRLPASKRDYVFPAFKDDDFNEEVRCHIPKIDEEYYWNPDVLEVLILAHTLNQKLLLTGLPGTGKSSACEQFAAWIKQPFLRLSCRGDMEASDLVGNFVASSTGMTFELGPLPIGLKHGYFICMDEVFKLPAHIQMTMQNLYEMNGYLTINEMPGTMEDKIVRPHKFNRIFATDNVKGTGDNFDKFAATQLQDSSSLDRFTMTHTVDYLPESAEITMLKNKFPSVSKDIIKSIVKVAGLVREGYKQGKLSVTLSGGRGLATICMLVDSGLDLKHSMAICYGNKLGDDTEVSVFKTMMQTVGV